MIDHIRGTVIHVGLDHCVVEAGGFGMRIEATPALLANLREGQEARVVTEFIVRQDAMMLFGFHSRDERFCFQALQTVTGVGARTALAVLAVHTPDELRTAIAAEDLAALQRVPGIGKKSASRMALELKDKIGPAPTTAPVTPAPALDGAVVDALIGLGWPQAQAEAAVAAVADPGASTAQLLRAALQYLGKK
ncbi:MAG: Holliday junction branch migration protein RuvA [Bowdeniella nasicola]|nr:Holliday junction branch migration protein RuvA [Bowdeniella nasicola]